MSDGAAGQRDVEQVLLGLFGSLLDRQRHFLGLAVTETDTTIAVADHHQGGEGEATATLDDLGDAVDGDDTRLAQPAGIRGALFVAIVAVIRGGGHQNSKPASRAAAATAAIRPW